MKETKKITISAVCMALCVVLPYFFHTVLGQPVAQLISPMHFPVLLCGLICGWQYGLLCGVAGPMLGMIITGMPQPAGALGMMIECGMYGAIAGLLVNLIKTKYYVVNASISLVIAMLFGRIFGGLIKIFVISGKTFDTFGLFFKSWFASYFAGSWLGILLQLVLLPLVIFALVKAKLIPNPTKTNNN